MLHNTFTFFGTSEFAVAVLEGLAKENILPALLVTETDKPKGRGLLRSSPVAKLWAQKKNIPVYQPETLDAETIVRLKKEKVDVFVVADYGKILPKSLLDIPTKGVINVHPSLLPKYRGPSPLETMILQDEKNIGVSLILLDEKMDHGPIIAEKEVRVAEWPISRAELLKILAKEGSILLAQHMPKWIEGNIGAKAQNDAEATYTKKFKKEDGLLDLSSDPRKNFLKFKALGDSIGVYFIATHKGKNIRIKITDATMEHDRLIIKRVIPEGRKEMSFEDYGRGVR